MSAVTRLSPRRIFAALVAFLVTATGLVLIPSTSAQASGACAAASAYAGGGGTSGDPYLISTPQQLAYLSLQSQSGTVSGHFLQTTDIDLAGCNWVPIASSGSSNGFNGTYDGGGFSINNFFVSSTSRDRNGLFGIVWGTVRALSINGTMAISGAREVGGVAGKLAVVTIGTATAGKIENVKVAVDITDNGTGQTYVGGIAGNLESSATISYSSFRGTITRNTTDINNLTSVGALAAQANSSATVQHSYAIATLTTPVVRTGGLVGANSVKMINSYGATNTAYGLLGNGTLTETGSTGSFWNNELGSTAAVASGAPTLAFARTTAQMKTISNYSEKSWAIVDGWEPFSAPTKIWGICGSDVNDGYPFLLWEYSAHPCPAPVAATSDARALTPAIHLALKASVGDAISGRPVEIAGTGLGGGSAYSLVVRSSPTTLQSGVADASGSFSKTLAMPSLPAGTHTLTLSALAPDGSTLTLVQTFTVSATGVVTSMSNPVGASTQTLAATGADSVSLAWGLLLALAMIAAGVWAKSARSRVNTL